MNAQKQEYFMRAALLESKKALPACFPNPPVGCVLVKDGDIVSRGFTQKPGSNHAEAEAIENYDGSFSGLSAFVTLEPCSFHGRTPSCAVTLIEKGVSSVYVALVDPDPRNNGKGIAQLESAGIKVIVGILADAVTEFISPHLGRS